MIVEGTHLFPGPREVVWALLLDPEVLAKTMPGTATIGTKGRGPWGSVPSPPRSSM